MMLQNKKVNLFSSLICIVILAGCFHTTVEKVWLDELDLSNSDQVAGSAVANKSMWGTPLIIARDTFERGVGMHASGLMRIKLNGGSQSFHALVGIDDSAPPNELAQASAEFFVYANGQELWRSGVMRAGDKARLVELDIKNVDPTRHLLSWLVNGPVLPISGELQWTLLIHG
jgi:alpha-galactosidase